MNIHGEPLTRDNAMQIFADYDLIVDGTDNFATRYLVNDAAVLLGKPYVWGSIYRFDGQASVFWAEYGPCYRCLYPEPPPPGMVPSCAEGGVLGVLCASIGSIQVTEAIKLLTGIGEPLVGRLMVYDALEMNYRTVKVRKDPNCAVCGEHPTVTELIDYDDFCGTVSDEAAEATFGSTITVGELRDWQNADKPIDLIDVREPAEWEIVRIPGARLVPEGRHPVRSGARRPAAGPADRPVLQDRHTVGRGARRDQGGRLQGRRTRPGWSDVLGQADRPVAAELLTVPQCHFAGWLNTGRAGLPARPVFHVRSHRHLVAARGKGTGPGER